MRRNAKSRTESTKTNYDTGNGAEAHKIKLKKGGGATEETNKKGNVDIGTKQQKRDVPRKTEGRQEAGTRTQAETADSEHEEESFGGCYFSFEEGRRTYRLGATWPQWPVGCSIYKEKQRKVYSATYSG